MTDFYILDQNKKAIEANIIEYAQFNSDANNWRVKKDIVGDTVISTVFLGVNHSYDGGRPLLFETMVFGGVHDEYMDRCSTWDEAIIQHSKVLNMVKDG
jgi:hypothetical protein